MYNFISGTLVEKTPTTAVIDAHGVGYELMVPLSTSRKLPGLGFQVKLKTYFVVREDVQQLFGFASDDEKEVFKLLISVSGIGPKTAITALSGIEIADLKRSIVNGDVATLTSIPGVGRKTSERLIVELREKIILEQDSETQTISTNSDMPAALFEDSLQALVSLGYSKQAAKQAIQKVFQENSKENWNPEQLIRASLKYI